MTQVSLAERAAPLLLSVDTGFHCDFNSPRISEVKFDKLSKEPFIRASLVLAAKTPQLSATF